MGRHNNGDGRGQRGIFDPRQAMAFQPALMRRTGLQSNDQHNQIGDIAGQVVPEERVVRNIEKSNHGSDATLSAKLPVFAEASCKRHPARRTFCRRTLASSPISVLIWSSASSCPRKSPSSIPANHPLNPYLSHLSSTCSTL